VLHEQDPPATAAAGHSPLNLTTMAKKFKVYDTETGRVVSIIERVADAVRLAAAVLTNGSAAVTVTSTTGLHPGMLLIGKGIAAGTTVATVDTATTFTMSANATADVGAPGVFILALSYIPYKADGTLEVKEVHLEHYRDLFEDVIDDVGIRLGYINDNAQQAYYTGSKEMKGVVLPGAMTVFGGPTGNDLGAQTFCNVFTDNPTFSVSDHVKHEPPREQKQKCSFVHFILDDGTLLPVLRMPSYDIVPVAS
jgi:hypothetical protein